MDYVSTLGVMTMVSCDVLYSSKDEHGATFNLQKPDLEHSSGPSIVSDWFHIPLEMGIIVLSSPYKNQILSIALGLILLVTGFIFV